MVFSPWKFSTHSAVSRGATQFLEPFFLLIIDLGLIWSAKTPIDDGGLSISSVLSGPSSTESDDLLPKYPASALEVFSILTWS